MAAIPLARTTSAPQPPSPPTTARIRVDTRSLLLQRCRTTGDLRQCHALLVKTGLIHDPRAFEDLLESAALLVPGAFPYALKVFDQMPHRNAAHYNVLIRGFTSRGRGSHEDALALFVRMLEDPVEPDDYTFSSLLKACSRPGAPIKDGEQVHGLALRLGRLSRVHARSSLVNMYASHGMVASARKVFDEMPLNGRSTWTSMLAGYSRNEMWEEVVELFCDMMGLGSPFGEGTLVTVLAACGRLGAIMLGEWIYQYAEENGMMGSRNLVTALIDMYAKCGIVDRARELFDKMACRDVIAWSTMISGYSQFNRCKEALDLFGEMQRTGVEPNDVTMVSVFAACTALGALETGKWVHSFMKRKQMALTVELGTALVDFYAKCGDISSALEVFKEMPCKNVWSWTVLIRGLANNGQGRKALKVFSLMLDAGIQPNIVTFNGVLSACSHAGLIEEGKHHFASMERDHGIMPGIDHYGCMVDMFGRAGLLDEAYCFIRSIPVGPNATFWRMLLASCRAHKNVELAETSFREITILEPPKDVDYILMCDVYASVGRLEDAMSMRSQMKEKGIKKTPGFSSVEVEGTMYEFFAEDTSHPQSEEIYKKVEEMMECIKLEGYIADIRVARLEAEEDDDKRVSVSHHSEKLAIAFALIRSSPGSPIRIIKNLRICADCHLAIKLISKVYDREIIIRDRSRFHHFKDGVCSCDDYW